LEATTVSQNQAAGKIEVRNKITIEYDGLMLFNIKTNYPSNLQPNSVTVDFPYNGDVGKYYMKWVKSKNEKYSGGIPSANGLAVQSASTPYFWIGNNDKGVFWFCERPKTWLDPKSQSPIKLTRSGDELVQSFDIGNAKNFEFGIQATPVKPLPADWRKWRFAPAINSNLIVPWPRVGDQQSTKYFGWPEAVNESNHKQMISKLQGEGKKVLSYIAITRLPSQSNIYQQNKAKWKQGKTVMKLKEDNLMNIEPSSPNYRETIAKQLADYVKRYNLDGYYFDGAKLPHDWRDNNNESYFPILAYRHLQRAVYESVKSTDPNALLAAHMSRDMDIPVLAYTDMYVDGEQFRYNDEGGKLAYQVKESYLDFIDLAQFRAEFIGKQWGLIPMFLPELDPSFKNVAQPTLGLASLLLLHDVQAWPIFSNVAVWNDMYKFLDAFGFQSATFIPYYSTKPPAVSNAKDVYVSAYTKGSEALLIVSNLTKNRLGQQFL
jgi:hypothetical protein